MNFNFKKTVAVFASLAVVFSFAGCNEDKNGKTTTTTTAQQNGGSKDDIQVNQTPSQDTLTEVTVDYLDTTSMFSNRDTNNSYEESDAELITLDGTSAKTNAGGVSLENGVLTISKEGVYVLSGSFNGQIVIDAPDTDKVQLVLKDAEITSDSSAAIYVKQADKLFVTTTDGSENKITATGAAVDDNGTNVDGAVFSKCDICVNGKGTLEINSTVGNGIVSKDDLIVGGGKYVVNAGNHGFDGKDSVRIADGDITVTSAKDGIHAENTEDTSKGFVYIEKGTFNLTTTGDGIASSMIVQIENGDYTIKTSGSSDVSSKGIKSETSLIINNGSFDITSTDDGLHSALNTVVNNGEITVSSDDDGVHSDNNISINGGTLNITKCYEGLEGQTINITGGTVELHASDDGMNAAGGNDQSGFGGMGDGNFGGGGRGPDAFAGGENATGYINISGGKVTVYAGGDGIDANGTIYVSGGETAVIGPENGGNGSMDYGMGAEITGGTFIAVGSSQMALNFSSGTQGAMLVTVSNGSDDLSIKDSNGNELYSCSPDINYSSVVFSSPDIKQGESYTVSANGSDYTVEMTSLLYGSGNGFGGMGGGNFGGGGRGDKPNYDMGNMNPGGNMPEDLPEGMEMPPEMPQPQF